MIKQFIRLIVVGLAIFGMYLLLPAAISVANAVDIEKRSNVSVKANVTILRGCSGGSYRRSRSVRNYLNKCQKRTRTRLRSVRSRTSSILQASQPRLRNSFAISRKSNIRPGYVRLLRRNVTSNRVRRDIYNPYQWTNYFNNKRKAEAELK